MKLVISSMRQTKFVGSTNTRCHKLIGMSRIPDIYPVSGTIRRFLRYPVFYPVFEVSGIRFLRYFQSSGKLRRVDSVKIKFTFSIYVKKFAASLKTLILFGLSTKSRTESKP